MDKIMEMYDLVTLLEPFTKDGSAEINIGVYNFEEMKMVHEKWEFIVRKGIIDRIIRNKNNFYLKVTPDPGLTFWSDDGLLICIYPESEYTDPEPRAFNEKLYHFLYYKEHYITPKRISGTVTEADVVSFTWP